MLKLRGQAEGISNDDVLKKILAVTPRRWRRSYGMKTGTGHLH